MNTKVQKVLILGGSVGGCAAAKKLYKEARKENVEVDITIIDPSSKVHYKPEQLFLALRGNPWFACFGNSWPRKLFLIGTKIKDIRAMATRIDRANKVVHTKNAHSIEAVYEYDVLVLATGARLIYDDDVIEGSVNAHDLNPNVLEFYTHAGAMRTAEALQGFTKGDLIIGIMGFPIVCPVAPFELAMLLESLFWKMDVHNDINITIVTAMSKAFTKEKCNDVLGDLFTKRNIKVVTNFDYKEITNDEVVSWGGQRVHFDKLVQVPLHAGHSIVQDAGLDDGGSGFLHAVITNDSAHLTTLQSAKDKFVFGIADAINLTKVSKAGSVGHFEGSTLARNVISVLLGKESQEWFDGHANCFILTGYPPEKRAFLDRHPWLRKHVPSLLLTHSSLIDFNAEIEPGEGHFPFGWGPGTLLGETRTNYFLKLAFKYIYIAVPFGWDIPFVPDLLSKSGKDPETIKAMNAAEERREKFLKNAT